MMGTRSGDLDPAIRCRPTLNTKSGVAGISGLGADFRAIETRFLTAGRIAIPSPAMVRVVVALALRSSAARVARSAQ
jgi:acetate kinase